MILHIRTLRTDGTVTWSTEYAPYYRNPANALVSIGAKLRRHDPSVCAIRADEITKIGKVPSWTWVGNYNKEQGEVIAYFERSGIKW